MTRQPAAWPPTADQRPLVIFTWGNASRGDDAAGPLLHERLEGWQSEHPAVNLHLVHDFQLQIEHALEIPEAALVLFIDAELHETQATAAQTTARIEPRRVHACDQRSPFSHALSPAQLLAVHTQVTGFSEPEAWQLGIPGSQFELGSGLSDGTEQALEVAWRLLEVFLERLPNAGKAVVNARG